MGTNASIEKESEHEHEHRAATSSFRSDASVNEAVVHFQHLWTGSVCSDGGDLFQGLADDYGGLSPFGGARRADPETSLFYGSKCRERCRQMRSCKFYSV